MIEVEEGRVYASGRVTWLSIKSRICRVIEGKRPVNTKRGHWDGIWGERTCTGSFTMFVGVWEGKGDVAVKKRSSPSSNRREEAG